MGKKKEFFDFVKIKGKIYKVSIQPYVSPEELFKRAVNSGAFTADELKEEYGQSREETRDMKTMESIHIDLSKKIFLLNGRPMEDVSELHLDFEKGEWSLQVTETVTYTGQRPDDGRGEENEKINREQDR